MAVPDLEVLVSDTVRASAGLVPHEGKLYLVISSHLSRQSATEQVWRLLEPRGADRVDAYRIVRDHMPEAPDHDPSVLLSYAPAPASATMTSLLAAPSRGELWASRVRLWGAWWPVLIPFAVVAGLTLSGYLLYGVTDQDHPLDHPAFSATMDALALDCHEAQQFSAWCTDDYGRVYALSMREGVERTTWTVASSAGRVRLTLVAEPNLMGHYLGADAATLDHARTHGAWIVSGDDPGQVEVVFQTVVQTLPEGR